MYTRLHLLSKVVELLTRSGCLLFDCQLSHGILLFFFKDPELSGRRHRIISRVVLTTEWCIVVVNAEHILEGVIISMQSTVSVEFVFILIRVEAVCQWSQVRDRLVISLVGALLVSLPLGYEFSGAVILVTTAEWIARPLVLITRTYLEVRVWLVLNCDFGFISFGRVNSVVVLEYILGQGTAHKYLKGGNLQ